MEELAVLAEIEHTEALEAIPAAFEPGLRRFRVYAAGGILPFMKGAASRDPVKASNIIADHIELAEAQSLEELRGLNAESGGWLNGGSAALVKFPGFRPPSAFSSLRHGVLEGFTDNSPVLLDGLTYRPGLLTAPAIEQCADAFTYDRMKFSGAFVSIDNADGRFDKADNLFGNEFNLRAGPAFDEKGGVQPQNYAKLIEGAGAERVASMRGGTDEYVTMIGDEKKRPSLDGYPLLAQYYVSNITASLDKATFHLKDKRERLAGKIPNRQFTAEEYEGIDDCLIGADMQEAYGRCFGVPGVCVEGKRIKAREGEPSDENGDMLQYRFRFSSGISRVDRIQVKMTAGEIPDPDDPAPEPENKRKMRVDGWTTVYQRVEPDVGSPDYWPGAYPRWKPGIIPGAGPEYKTYYSGKDMPVADIPAVAALLGKGEITLHWEVAKQGGKRENNINEARMDGVFNNPEKRNISAGEFVTPLDIIKDVMANYSGVPYLPHKYDIGEIEGELAPLGHEIGIMFDKPISVYEAVERLQSGCAIGFQFCVYRNRFTARLDDPNRDPAAEIKAAEILNLGEVEIDWNAELYGTYADIGYAYDYGEQAGRRFLYKDMREKVLEKHRVDKEWAAETLLAGEAGAKLKAEILMEDFAELRPLIKNIKLEGGKWLGLRVYDILLIDFSIRGEERAKCPHHVVRLIEEIGNSRSASMRGGTDEYVTMIGDEKEASGSREFAGENVRCQVLRVEFDARSGITTLDARVRGRSEKWQA